MITNAQLDYQERKRFIKRCSDAELLALHEAINEGDDSFHPDIGPMLKFEFRARNINVDELPVSTRSFLVPQEIRDNPLVKKNVVQFDPEQALIQLIQLCSFDKHILTMAKMNIPGFQVWFAERESKQDQLKQQALAKLSEDEKKALGLK